MAEVVLDANVIVAILYEADSQHRRARELVDRLEGAGDSLVLNCGQGAGCRVQGQCGEWCGLGVGG